MITLSTLSFRIFVVVFNNFFSCVLLSCFFVFNNIVAIFSFLSRLQSKNALANFFLFFNLSIFASIKSHFFILSLRCSTHFLIRSNLRIISFRNDASIVDVIRKRYETLTFNLFHCNQSLDFSNLIKFWITISKLSSTTIVNINLTCTTSYIFNIFVASLMNKSHARNAMLLDNYCVDKHCVKLKSYSSRNACDNFETTLRS